MFYLYLGYGATHKVNNLITQNGGGIVMDYKDRSPDRKRGRRRSFKPTHDQTNSSNFTPVNVLVQEK